jgi:hypothetical protein
MYVGCPIVWAFKLQPLIALSTTEAEYIALSTALREVIAVMNLLNELKSNGFQIHSDIPKVKCRVFEDNKSLHLNCNEPQDKASNEMLGRD